MTWEWAFFLSVVQFCTCALYVFKTYRETNRPKDYDTELTQIRLTIKQLKSDHESLQKTAEEAKKLLSQANLAIGFVPRGQR